jgi:CRISPR-associated protein Csx17
MPDHLELHGCRHDILGHYLKAIGLLRVLAKCADEGHRDTEAEGWWDNDKACFCLSSPKYLSREKLVEFFERHYQPTPFFSPWNTGGGLNEKKEIEFSIPQKSWQEFWASNRDTLLPLIANKETRSEMNSQVLLGEKPLKLALTEAPSGLKPHPDIAVVVGTSKGKKSKPHVEFSWSENATMNFFNALTVHRDTLERIINFTKPVKAKFVPGSPVLTFDVSDETALSLLPDISSVCRDVRTKEDGKKAVMANLVKLPNLSSELRDTLSSGQRYFARFNTDDAEPLSLLEEMRSSLPPGVVESIDAVLSTKAGSRPSNNPLFLNRGMGEGGNDEMFRQFWVMFLKFAEAPTKDRLCTASLMAESNDCELADELGFPFFPDAIKSYNQGGGWVQNSFKFNPLDYVLAMEGAFALRGSVARKLGTNARRFAAFPFIFETGDLLTDGKDMKSAAAALWLPLWTRRTSFDELSSFIADAQARLPGKDVRFSAELTRAIHAQGVDAGFTGWQEFRFKMKIGRVPWVTTGAYVQAEFSPDATRLNRALQPLDESQFLDQFDPFRDPKSGKLKKDGPHTFRESINAAMETATRETTPHHCLDLLCAVFSACNQMAVSKSFRETLRGEPRFFRSLPMKEWNALLARMNEPEFRIARAVASMTGGEKQRNGEYSKVLPMLGSLLPLTLEKWGWHLPLPPKEKPSKQAVWTGTDVCHDLAAMFARRYLGSLKDDRPALTPPHDSLGARLGDALAFLNRELDDHLIARWIEALILIGWKSADVDDGQDVSEPEAPAIPPEYAALRILLELECKRRDEDDTKRRRSQQPIALLCQRSASTLPLAVKEALRWIAIWGVPNPYANKAKKPRLAGSDIINLSLNAKLSFVSNATRLAAAVCIPLHWRDRNALYRAVSLPQTD